MITGLKFAGIPTRDQERAVAFWTGKIGCKVVTDQPLGAQRWIELSIGRRETRIVLFTPEGHEERIGSFFNGSFECDDVERTYEQLGAKGVTFKAPPEKQPWGRAARTSARHRRIRTS